MRYRIYCGTAGSGGVLQRNDSTLLLDSAEPETKEKLTAARLNMGINRAGQLTAALLKGHRMYDNLRMLRTVAEVVDGDATIWRGRVLQIEEDRDGKRTVKFEGNLNGLYDVPDTMTNPSAIAKHYKVGSDNGALTLAFTEQTVEEEGTGLFYHYFSNEERELFYLSEFGAVFYVEWDGTLYELTLNEVDEYDGTPVTLHRIGFIGNITIIDDSYSKNTNDKGANAPFYIQNGGAYTKDSAATHNVKIYRRDALTVQQMFQLMFTDATAYNGYQTPENYLMRGTCDIVGSEIYDPGIETTCMGTLLHWVDKFGGYMYTTYNSQTERWYINYTQTIGANRDDVPVAYGLNLVDINVTSDGSDVITAICGIGVDDEDETVYTLAGEGIPVSVGEGYTREASTGYVKYTYMWEAFGAKRKQKRYAIPHNTANKYQYLYNLVALDLAAGLNTKAIKLTALDARLLSDAAGRPEIGDNIPPQAPQWGLNGTDRFKINEMEIDFINQGNGAMRLGNEQKTITQLI